MSRLLTILAFACCVVVASSFAFFADDQLAGASLHEQHMLSGATDPAAPAAHRAGEPRRTIDAVDERLTSPFRSLLHSDSQWILRGASTLIALLVYGLGLGFLSRYARGSRARPFLGRARHAAARRRQ